MVACQARAQQVQMLFSPMPGVSEPATAGGEPRGVAVDILHEISRRSGVEMHLAFYPQARTRLLVEQQEDTCMPVVHLAEMSARYKWSAPMMQIRMVMLARHDNPLIVRSTEQLKTLRVGAARGTMVAERLKQMGVPLDESADYQHGLEKLGLGRLDLWAMLDIGLQSLSRSMGMAPPRVVWVLDTLDVSFACNQKMDNATLTSINQAISAMRKDGTMAHFNLH
ncbi:hypothetical protein BI343_14270 [Chromobacterium amazonense]|nr:hypothetical protein BI343_14270 [Chromobacterium amazonense]